MIDTTWFMAGSLFTGDYLADGIRGTPDYIAVDAAALTVRITAILDAFPRPANPNEAQTEDDLIWPILAALGWTDALRQQNLTVSGRDDVPDGLLFAGADAKARANTLHSAGPARSTASAGVTRVRHRRHKCCATCAVSTT